MFIGGFLIDYFGKVKMLSIYLITLIIVVSALSFLKFFWQNELFMIGFIIAFYTLVTFSTIAIFASSMQLCWERVAATQFTLYMAISNLGLAGGAALIRPLKGFFAWEYVLLAYIVFALIMLVLLRFIKFDKHQLRADELELQYLER